MLGGKRNVTPRSRRENERPIVRSQGHGMSQTFRGMVSDKGVPVPPNYVRVLDNYVAMNDHLAVRRGTKVWSDTALPAAIYQTAAGTTTRTGMTIRKTGSTVTWWSGAVSFLSTDVGKYIVRDNGTHDRIIAYTSAYTVTVDNADYTDGGGGYEESTAAWVRDEINGQESNELTGRVVLHIGTRLFVSDGPAIGSWTEAYVVSRAKPANAPSTVVCYKQWAYVFTSNGLFRIDLKAVPFVAFKVNGPLPTVRPTDQNVSASGVVDTEAYPYARRRTYTMSRLSGQGYRNRMTPGVAIEAESGTVKPDNVGGTMKDYGIQWTARPPAGSGLSYAVLTGGEVPLAYNTAVELEEVDDGQFRVEVNGDEQNILVDFSGIGNMTEACERLQEAMREFWPSIDVEWDIDHFIVTAKNEGDEISYFYPGDGGEDLSIILALGSGNATITNPAFGEPVSFGPLTMPTDPATDIDEWQWTHYSVYTTLDIGTNGYDPITGDGNNTELLIWLEDYPVARAILASNSALGICTAEVQQKFYKQDVGDTIEWVSGTTATILYLCDSAGTEVFTDSSQWCRVDSATVVSQSAAAMGGGVVMTVNQSGQTVTITSGTRTVTTADLGRPVWFGGDQWDFIIEIVSSTQFKVYGSVTRSAEAATMGPVSSRTVADYWTDEELRARINAFALRQRFWSPLPNADIGEIAAGFILCAVSNTTDVLYGQIPQYYEHLSGYHRQDFQRFTLKMRIANMRATATNLGVFGQGTVSIPLSTYVERTVDELGEKVVVLPSQHIVDENIGSYRNAVRPVDQARMLVITNEPGLRVFDGQQYGENIIAGQVQDELRGLVPEFCLAYDPIQRGGAYIFGSDEVAS